MSVWLNRQHGEVDFFLTQLLSGHGFFREYLHKRGFASSAQCPECGLAEQTAEHVFFDCSRFEEARQAAMGVARVPLTTHNVVAKMCREERTWIAVCQLAKYAMTALQQRWNIEKQQPSRAITGGVG